MKLEEELEIERLGDIARIAAEHNGTWDCKYRRAAAAVRAEVLRGLQPPSPQPPPNYHLATDEERKCLPEGSKVWDLAWKDSRNIGCNVSGSEDIYACPDAPALVSFTDGKLNPPPFGKWHREDWTPEMLAGGWRPTKKGEIPVKREDEISFDAGESWEPADDSWQRQRTWPGAGGSHMRTRRPLPAPPAEEWVPLSKEDFDQGLWQISRNPEHSLHLVTRVHHCGILTDSGGCEPTLFEIGFSNLMCGYQRRNLLDPRSEWKPCKKLKTK
jgi:hypothetical protein